MLLASLRNFNISTLIHMSTKRTPIFDTALIMVAALGTASLVSCTTTTRATEPLGPGSSELGHAYSPDGSWVDNVLTTNVAGDKLHLEGAEGTKVNARRIEYSAPSMLGETSRTICDSSSITIDCPAGTHGQMECNPSYERSVAECGAAPLPDEKLVFADFDTRKKDLTFEFVDQKGQPTSEVPNVTLIQDRKLSEPELGITAETLLVDAPNDTVGKITVTDAQANQRSWSCPEEHPNLALEPV